MTLDEFQQSVDRTRNPALDARDRLLDAAAGLAEEGGEVLAQVRRHAFQAQPLDTARLAEELGDALWCLAATAADAGLSLGSIAAANRAKLERRHPGGFRPPARPADDGLEGR
jgi:NTP pyrophosphatase (non-canonical NTP hydrolase)